MKQKPKWKKAKERRKALLMTIQTDIGKDDDYVKPFHIQLAIHTQLADFKASTLLDTGVDCNVQSYDARMALGQPALINIQMNFQSFSQEETPCIGKCCIKLFIQDNPQYVNLYVANKHQSMIDVVLGKS